MTQPAKPTAGDDYHGLPEIYYMRDNHTFRRLPNDVERALIAIRQEWDDGYTGGMLCSKHSELRDSVHAHGKAKWNEFEAQARAWLGRAV